MGVTASLSGFGPCGGVHVFGLKGAAVDTAGDALGGSNASPTPELQWE